ncbi:MAG: bifunctional glutamate N-acetyltransferase/amino-acid acetyltransferase ArgJ [Coriobacteriales bacterium]|nr:bifunctional glutamate N-acetyltransferase/amino-acid acetyltransferase ArgJ [Coriobacteriales bacterium]
MAEGGVVAPEGFTAGAASAGIKAGGKRDIAVVACDKPVPTAAVFTTNAFAAPPVAVSREHVSAGYARAVVINSGNANAATGEQGMRAAYAMAEAAAKALDASAAEIVVGSTGVIGVQLPVELVTAGIADAVASLDNREGDSVAAAIMTTDTFAKQIALRLDANGNAYRVGGMAKGSGMIMPNMATMLAVVTTDAPLSPAACDEALRHATSRTFNRITVDSDTSTNDMVVLMASGAAGIPDGSDGDADGRIGTDHELYAPVAQAIETVCAELAKMIVLDGEGATKLVTVTVRGASSEADAETAAFAVANSPLVKTALFGEDANWGRVAMALGKSGAQVDPNSVDISFAGIVTCRGGEAVDFSEEEAAVALAADEIEIACDLGLGDGTATVLTCDLSYEYVRINGEYRS